VRKTGAVLICPAVYSFLQPKATKSMMLQRDNVPQTTGHVTRLVCGLMLNEFNSPRRYFEARGLDACVIYVLTTLGVAGSGMPVPIMVVVCLLVSEEVSSRLQLLYLCLECMFPTIDRRSIGWSALRMLDASSSETSTRRSLLQSFCLNGGLDRTLEYFFIGRTMCRVCIYQLTIWRYAFVPSRKYDRSFHRSSSPPLPAALPCVAFKQIVLCHLLVLHVTFALRCICCPDLRDIAIQPVHTNVQLAEHSGLFASQRVI
jgi:hypothetical protein